jgi:hypothetical protein
MSRLFLSRSSERERLPGARVVAALVAEVAGLFPDELFHIGGDETIALGRCDTGSFHR